MVLLGLPCHRVIAGLSESFSSLRRCNALSQQSASSSAQCKVLCVQQTGHEKPLSHVARRASRVS